MTIKGPLHIFKKQGKGIKPRTEQFFARLAISKKLALLFRNVGIFGPVKQYTKEQVVEFPTIAKSLYIKNGHPERIALLKIARKDYQIWYIPELNLVDVQAPIAQEWKTIFEYHPVSEVELLDIIKTKKTIR